MKVMFGRCAVLLTMVACSAAPNPPELPDAGTAAADAANACANAQGGDPGTGPFVSSICGSFDHGRSVTLHGARFGTKQAQTPYVWDDASGTSLSEKWDYAYPSQNPEAFRIDYRTPAQVTLANGVVGGVPLPHAHDTKYIAGAHFGTNGNAYNAYAGGMVAFGKNGQQGQTDTYISYYRRIDPNWTLKTNCTIASDCDHNFKDYDYASGTGPYGSGPNLYFNCASQSNPLSTLQWSGNYLEWKGSSIFSWNSATNHAYFTPPGLGPIFSNVTVQGPGMGWQKIELVLKHGSDDGFHRIYQDNVLAWDVSTNDSGSATGPISETVAGGYAREYGDTEPFKNNWRYYADVYYDHSFARVVLANDADYSKATIIEPQPHVAWADGEIQLTVNLGKLSGVTAYVFVFDGSNTRSMTGVPVAVGP
jgi:hypothetical protein